MTARQLFMAGGAVVVPHPLFCSGASRPAEIDGLVSIAHPLGVVATEASAPCLGTLAQLSYQGYPLFVDSGAYGLQQAAVNAGGNAQDLDFDEVFDCYEMLVRNARPGQPAQHLYLVMPDVVGNQRATVALLNRYAPRIAPLLAAGVEVIVPLQAGGEGALSLQAAVEELLALLGPRIRLGIPSANARALKALPNAMLAQVRHDRFHILGMATMGKAFAARVAALAQEKAVIDVSCDAVLFRKDTATLSQLTQQYRPWIEATTALQDYVDDTEAIGAMWLTGDGLTERQVRAIARLLGQPEAAMANAWRNAQKGDAVRWGEMLEACPEPWLHACFDDALRQQVPKLQSRQARATALADLLVKVQGTGEIASLRRRHVQPRPRSRQKISGPAIVRRQNNTAVALAA
jgi:cytochrome c553